MRNRLVYALSAVASLAILASCSGANSPGTQLPGNSLDGPVLLPTAARLGAMSILRATDRVTAQSVHFPSGSVNTLDQNAAKLPGTLVYVADEVHYLVTVFNHNGKNLGNINNIAFPQGIAVDAAHNLWVTQPFWPDDHRFPQTHTVLEFARGETRPSKTLLDPAGLPLDVSVCPNGTVYVANSQGADGGNGNIQVYSAGSTTATGTLTYPDDVYNGNLTCDAAGNVFSGVYQKAYPYGGAVVEFPGGRQSGATKIISNVVPGGIKSNKAGNLLIDDQFRNTVCEYTEAGRPTGKCVSTGNYWVDLAVNGAGDVVFGANFQTSDVTSLQFPSGKPGVIYAGNANPTGVAYDPG